MEINLMGGYSGPILTHRMGTAAFLPPIGSGDFLVADWGG